MEMTEKQIFFEWKNAKNPRVQIEILADINLCKKSDIKRIIAQQIEIEQQKNAELYGEKILFANKKGKKKKGEPLTQEEKIRKEAEKIRAEQERIKKIWDMWEEEIPIEKIAEAVGKTENSVFNILNSERIRREKEIKEKLKKEAISDGEKQKMLAKIAEQNRRFRKKAAGDVTDEERQKILEMARSGISCLDISKALNRAWSTVYRQLENTGEGKKYLPKKRKRLTPEEVEMIRKKYRDGEKIKKIAEEIGCSEFFVKSRTADIKMTADARQTAREAVRKEQKNHALKRENRNRIVGEEERQEIIKLAISGERICDIMAIMGRTRETINKILREKNFEKRPQKISNQERDLMIELAEQGKSYSEIAKITRRSRPAVYQTIRSAGHDTSRKIPRPSEITDDERKKIIELIKNGDSCGKIAEISHRSVTAIRHIANAENLKFYRKKACNAITDEEIEIIKNLAESGFSCKHIAIQTGRHHRTISRILREIKAQGIAGIKCRNMTQEEREKAEEMYRKGKSIEEIAFELQRTESTIRRILGGRNE